MNVDSASAVKLRMGYVPRALSFITDPCTYLTRIASCSFLDKSLVSSTKTAKYLLSLTSATNMIVLFCCRKPWQDRSDTHTLVISNVRISVCTVCVEDFHQLPDPLKYSQKLLQFANSFDSSCPLNGKPWWPRYRVHLSKYLTWSRFSWISTALFKDNWDATDFFPPARMFLYISDANWFCWWRSLSLCCLCRSICRTTVYKLTAAQRFSLLTISHPKWQHKQYTQSSDTEYSIQPYRLYRSAANRFLCFLWGNVCKNGWTGSSIVVLAEVSGCWRLRTCTISVTECSSSRVTMLLNLLIWSLEHFQHHHNAEEHSRLSSFGFGCWLQNHQ